MINRRVLAASMVMALSLMASPAVYAAQPNDGPLHVKTAKVKLLSISLRNDSKSTIKVLAGANELTVEPGKTVNTKLAAGEKIVSATDSATNPSGTVLAVMANQLKDATIVLH